MHITGMMEESRRIAHIADPVLRNVLISTAQNIEQMLKNGQINLTTPLGNTLPHGLRVEVSIEHKGDDKPMIFTFTYSLDQARMKQWLTENPYLCEGALSFVSRGIEIVIPYGPDKLDKAGFAIDHTDGEQKWLPLLEHPIVFKAHRNLFGGQEWECFYTEEQ